MSLIEKATERLERERAAKAAEQAKLAQQAQPAEPIVPTVEPAPPLDLTNAVEEPPAERDSIIERALRMSPRPAPSVSTTPDPAMPRDREGLISKVIANPDYVSASPGASTRSQRSQGGRDSQEGGTSQTFRIDFKSLEKQGFVARPFARGRLAEDLRALKQRLMNRMKFFSLDVNRTPGRRQNVIMVSSSWAGEGKTFTAANLALSLTLEDRVNVMLIDGDVIRPSVHSLFGVDGNTGLTDYLRVRDSNLSPYLWRAENAPLTILPAGGAVQAPRELFRSDDMSRFIYDVSSRFSDRLVIVDTPPLLVTAEAPVLANHADQILLVVQASRTSQTAVENALESVRKDHVGLHSFLSMRRMEDSLRNASALRLRHSQSLANRRHRPSQAKVRSTTQRRGSTTKPLAWSERLTISTFAFATTRLRPA